jgi:cytochrome c-type biogenesis protein CcmF
VRLFREPMSASLRRAAGLPRSAFGTTLAHFGMGVTLLGIVGTTAFQAEAVVAMKPGDKATFGHYEATFTGVADRLGPNYSDRVAAFTMTRNGEPFAGMEAAKRFYPSRQMPTTESGIRNHFFDQIYISLGEVQADGSIAVHFYEKPLVSLIWLGAVVMALGGGLSLSDRRLRVGAPRPARAARLQPAE